MTSHPHNFACLLFSFEYILIFCFSSCMIRVVLTLTVLSVFAVCINLGHLKYFQCNVMFRAANSVCLTLLDVLAVILTVCHLSQFFDEWVNDTFVSLRLWHMFLGTLTYLLTYWFCWNLITGQSRSTEQCFPPHIQHGTQLAACRGN